MQAGREIKFRGKPLEDYGDVKWFYGSAVLDYEEKLAYIVSPGQGHVPVEWESVGQFTGLRDSNGKEIYEGDIVKSSHPIHDGEKVHTNAVSFVDYAWRLVANDVRAQNIPLNLYARRIDTIEVVGNIYENSELLL